MSDRTPAKSIPSDVTGTKSSLLSEPAIGETGTVGTIVNRAGSTSWYAPPAVRPSAVTCRPPRVARPGRPGRARQRHDRQDGVEERPLLRGAPIQSYRRKGGPICDIQASWSVLSDP